MPDIKRSLVKKGIKLLRKISPRNKQTKTHIVFEACEKFHYFHMESIIENIIADDRFEVSIIKWGNFSDDEKLPNVHYLTFDEFWHDWFNIYDILVTTELDRRPGWFDGTAVCMFHGAGPKMSYIKDPSINQYDIIFSVGPMTYDVQKAYVNNNVKIASIGLPITDILVSETKISLPDCIAIDSNKPTLMYAPSWSYYPEQVSMDDQILNVLAEIDDYNIIIRPHPNLLIPERCGGIDWKTKLEKLQLKGIQVSQGKDHSVYDLLQHVDVLLGDMSSVTYEYLILNRPIILYIKDGIFDELEASDFIDPLLSATTKLESATSLKSTLKSLKEKDLSAERIKLLNKTLFNVGAATNAALDTIKGLLK